MSLELNDVINLLEAQFPSWTIQAPRMQNEPDAVIQIQPNGGGALFFDGAFEEVFLMFRSRAGANEDAVAEANALALHEYLSNIDQSFQMGSTYVLSVQSVGGPPRYAGQDVDLRSHWELHYRFLVEV